MAFHWGSPVLLPVKVGTMGNAGVKSRRNPLVIKKKHIFLQ